VKSFLFHPEAREELKAIGRYYAERSPDAARRFYEEMDKVLTEIRTRPTLHRLFDPPARRHFGAAFPYAMIYLDRPGELWIVAVMHFKQRPGYWRERLP
jgi:toxin ParE1/3/4